MGTAGTLRSGVLLISDCRLFMNSGGLNNSILKDLKIHIHIILCVQTKKGLIVLP